MPDPRLLTRHFSYDLPPELVAQVPLPERDASRLMVVEREGGRISHRIFRDLPSVLAEGDLVLLNESRVVPARLRLVREGTGGKVEVLLLRRRGDVEWEALLKPGSRLREGLALVSPRGEKTRLEIIGRQPDGNWLVRSANGSDGLEAGGEVPLPPYIRRSRDDARLAMDRERYQTVYARIPGSVAAPTAGLHFTPAVLDGLAGNGIRTARFALHIGRGTFAPVREELVDRHRMHAETFEFPEEARAAVEEAHRTGRRVVAAGTSAVRVLEEAAGRAGEEGGLAGETSLFIRPGFRFRSADAMLTNFHLPCSTPFILVCAFAGMDLMRRSYATAVAERYRFLSYGDAMLIL